jgi:2-amino-4-hydroxy-6-hydroxymethyldihydropteridine diphosphokinase
MRSIREISVICGSFFIFARPDFAAMASCLIALGSNLGERAELLQRAVGELARLRRSRLLARSAWQETPAAGGPAGQGAFLNGAALVATELAPAVLHRELTAIESRLGRVRRERWGARAIDLDLLLYDRLELSTPELAIPHPRMAFRRFVLAPAAEIAAWMVHPESGWTIGRLCEQLDAGADYAAVIDADPRRAARLAARLGEMVGDVEVRAAIETWTPRPKLIVAAGGDSGVPASQWRKMLNLPARGPVAWVGGASDQAWLDEAVAAVRSVW